jgi:hypothetical protein
MAGQKVQTRKTIHRPPCGNVRLWPKADIPVSPFNVRFRGKSGRRNLRASRPLLTQSGHLASVLPTGVRGYFDIEVKSSFLPAQRFIERDSWAVLRVRLHKNNVHIPL